MELIKFEAPYPNNCSKCEKLIPAGDDVYAKNIDEVVAGQGICTECAIPAPKEPVKKPK